jgi:hypothetical protein
MNRHSASWIDNPLSLLDDCVFVPETGMTRDEKTNAITRLLLLVVLVLYLLRYKHSGVVLISGLLIILILYFSNIKEYYGEIQMDAPIPYKNRLLSQNAKAQEKMSLQPIIAPRSHDREVWSYPSYRHSAVNYNNGMYDISEQYEPVPQTEDYKEYDPRLQTYTGFGFDKLSDWCKTNPQSAPQNTTPVSREGFVNPAIQTSLAMQASRDAFTKAVSRERFSSENTHPASIPSTQTTALYPDGSLLIPKTATSIYALDSEMNRDRYKYMENVQPETLTYSDVSYPINSNIGISYTPQQPPLVLDQVAMNDASYPLFHRIDPQLVRDQNLSEDRLSELPRRTTWSSKYSGLEAGPGTVNFEDIYDPRFNGYGDPYRSYGDVNLGQVQYYYSDLDAYRYPNFGIRSKVDFIDFVDPMGKVLPEYTRQVGLDDVRKEVHNQYTADSVYFREDLQERLMRKRNRELWQLRAMPQRKTATSGSFTSGM